MVVPLPKYVVFPSTSKKKFICPSGSDGCLKFSEVDMYSEGVKHEIVNSTESGRVHIKCVDTGKYWSWGLDSNTNGYIAVQSNKREANRSSNKCTLVKYSHHTAHGVGFFKLRFQWNSKWHVIRQDSLGFLRSGETKDAEIFHEFIIQDWAELARSMQNIGGGTSSSIGKPKKIAGGGESSGKLKKIAGGGESSGKPKKIAGGGESSGKPKKIAGGGESSGKPKKVARGGASSGVVEVEEVKYRSRKVHGIEEVEYRARRVVYK